MPSLISGQASLTGRVLDSSGHGVSGATITIAETEDVATSDVDGVYRLTPISDSTLTLVTRAPGFAPTFRESVILAANATVDGFDVLLLPADELTAINTMGAPGQEATRGVMAVRLRSMDARCVLDGARVTVWPPMAAKVVYSRPGVAGTPEQPAPPEQPDVPDPTLQAVQPGAQIDLWLAAAMPPGNMLILGVEQEGCRLMTPAPSMAGLTMPGLRAVAAQSLTQAELFLEGAP
jgi:Carboxypeptidase regulatory-like domain